MFGNVQQTLDRCASDLADRSRSGQEYSAKLQSWIDELVDACLVGFGVETAAKRIELARLFSGKAPPTELSERVRKRILRE
jgi:hypothetical protein